MFRLLILLALCVACGKTPSIKTTATANKTVSLAGIGSLSSKLEIRQSGDTAIAVAWFTWSGLESVTITSTVTLYRFDTNKLAQLQTTESSFDLEPSASKSLSTDTTAETRRRCAAITVTIAGFNANGDEKTNSANAQVCEKG